MLDKQEACVREGFEGLKETPHLDYSSVGLLYLSTCSHPKNVTCRFNYKNIPRHVHVQRLGIDGEKTSGRRRQSRSMMAGKQHPGPTRALPTSFIAITSTANIGW